MKGHFISLTILQIGLAIAIFDLPSVLAAGRPDPMALLQGVESIRLQIPPSTLRLRYRYRNEFVTNELILEVDFDGPRRAFTCYGEPPAMVWQAIFDGSKAITEDEEQGNVQLLNLDQQNPMSLFDPRALGVSTYYNWEDDVKALLPYRQASRVELIGPEDIGGKSAWHVRMDMVYKNQPVGTFTPIDYWIDSDHGFRVYRKDYNFVKTISTYENDDYAWLPNRVVSEDYGNQHQRWEVEILRAISPARFPEARWTLAGMELKSGTDVIDDRINRRVGFWNGTRYVALHPELEQRSPRARLMTWIICAGLLLLPPTIIWYQRSRSARH